MALQRIKLDKGEPLTKLEIEEALNDAALAKNERRWRLKFRGQWVGILSGGIVGGRGFGTLGALDRYLDRIKRFLPRDVDVLEHYFSRRYRQQTRMQRGGKKR